jgi:hypothetical protein
MRVHRNQISMSLATVVVFAGGVAVGLTQRADRVLGAPAAYEAAAPIAANAATCQTPQWWKGQTHAHANWGVPQLPTTSPDVVARWYREHNYNFVSVTDLNYYTPPGGLKAVFDAPGRFLVIPGEEPSREPKGVGVQIIDTIGLGITGPVDVAAVTGATSVEVLNSEAQAIRRAGGLPIAAHPNLTYALSAADLIGSDRTREPRFFEVWNTEPGMNNLGGGGKPSTEQMWDEALTTGRAMYGVAADDSHHFYTAVASQRQDEPLSNPGRAWIMVRSCELSWDALRTAMLAGDFYATTGITLLDYRASRAGVSLKLDDHTRDLGWSVNGNNPELYTTTFIGRGGKVLKVDTTLQPSYTFTAADSYVRAKVVSSDGYLAWTQPVFRG